MPELNLTTGQANRIQRYLWSVRDKLNLSHWEVYLCQDLPDDPEAIAEIAPNGRKNTAGVSLSERFMKLDADEKRHVITHELIHLHHRNQTEVIRVALHESGYVTQAAYDMLWATFNDHTEVMVDNLARLLAPHMPEWPS